MGSSPGNALQKEYRVSSKWGRRGGKVQVFIWVKLKLGRRCLAMGEMMMIRQGGWREEWEADENRRRSGTEMIHVAACSGGCVAVQLNVTHYQISCIPLPLFLLATAPWHSYTDILDAAIQIQKCAAGQQMRDKVFSCVLHLQQPCARDVTHPARSLFIPVFSGLRLRSPGTVRLLFILNSTSWQARAYTFIYNRISGQLIWDSQWLIPALRQEEQAGHFSSCFISLGFFH